jgi:hypothetical protein
LQGMLHDPENWWNQSVDHVVAVENFKKFVGNMTHNFGEDSPCYDLINSAANWEKWRAKLLEAVNRYPEDSRAWQKILSS